MLGASFGSELETATLHGTCARDASAVRFNQALHGGQAARRVRQTHHCKISPTKTHPTKTHPEISPAGPLFSSFFVMVRGRAGFPS